MDREVRGAKPAASPPVAKPAASGDPWTIGRLLTWTTKYLGDQGADSPRLDAEVLLAEARGCQRIELYTSFEDPASDELRTAFRELVRRRAEGMPVAYLVGRKEFYSLSFRVTSDVLIPRPETELLVVRMLDLAKQLASAGETPSIVDVGTGSGVIAICAAKKISQAEVFAVDQSPAALEVARANAESHGVAERVEFSEGDLLNAWPAEPRFDLIVSNPPYISTAEMAGLDATVRDFEPHAALESGPTGLEVIERLIDEALSRLKPGGWLLLEVGHEQGPAVNERLQAAGYVETAIHKDLAGLSRVAAGRRAAD